MKTEKSPNLIIQVNDVSIGNNLCRLREAKNLKQTEFVKQLQLSGIDISIFSYNRIEKGKQNPTVSLLLTCCKLLDCDMNDIFK